MSAPVVAGLFGSLLSIPFKEAAKVGLSAVSSWIVAGAQAMLAEVIKVISLVTTPSLSASWFSASYWRIAGLAMLLTVPFLFAAAVQAVIRTDMGVLLRAAFIDLPIAVLAVTVTAPLIALLLSATDEMCAVVTGGGTAGGSFLAAASSNLSNLPNGFMLLVIALVILLAGMALMLELIMRAAAIYIVVLFLPLGFAAMVWPARRVWVKRMVELLIALILSKFAMVAILSLAVSGLASFGAGDSSLGTALTAMALMVLASFSPWALLRLLPFTELAAGAGAMLGQESRQGLERGAKLGFNTAALAADPITAGSNALGHLVRNSATSASPDRGGLPLLGSASARMDRSGGSGPQAGADGADGAYGADGNDEANGARGAGPAGGPGGSGGSGGAGGASGRAAPEAPPGAPAFDSGGSVDLGADRGAPRASSANPSGSRDPAPGPTPPSPKGPVEAFAPILHPDNALKEVALRGDGTGGLIAPDRGAGTRHRLGDRTSSAPEDAPGGGGQ